MLTKFPFKSMVVTLLILAAAASPLTGMAGPGFRFRPLADIESQALTFLQDRDGFVWIGTYVDGLYRFDGKRLKHYVSASGFIRANNIPAILEDRGGRLWFAAAGGGLTCYDKETDTIRHFTHDPEDPESIGSNNFFWNGKNCLAQDREGDLWIGTIGGGLNRLDRHTRRFQRFVHDPANPLTIASDNVRSVLADQQGRIWAGTEKGLSMMAPDRAGFTFLPLVPGTAPKLIMAIFEDSQGQIWVGTENNGLYRFNEKTTRFTPFRSDPDDPGSLAADRVVHIAEQDKGRLIISHEDRCSMFLPGKNRFIRFNGTDQDLTMAFADPGTDLIWGLTDKGKIMVHNPHALVFNQYDADPHTPNSLSSEVVVSILEGSRGHLWIATLKGLNRYDPGTGRFTHYFHDPKDPGSIPSTADYSPGLFEDSKGTLWIGSSIPSALSVFDRDQDKVVKTYYPDPGDPQSLPDAQQINRMVQDREDPGIMWISTAKGLVRFNTRTEVFTTFGHDNSWSLMDDGKGVIWFSTWGRGLGRFDKKTKAISYLGHNAKDPSTISDNLLVPIFTASDGQIWVGTENGLNRFDRQARTFKRYRRKDGYPFDAVHSIGQDPRGHLWLGTNQGLVRFTPSTGQARAFTREDGVQSIMFYANNGITARTGEMWFGGTRGMTSFFPGDLTLNTHVPQVRLCEIRQGGQPVRFGKAPERLTSITLDWQQNFFEFEFAAFDYANPRKNRYAYMLEGFDKEWFMAGHNNFGRYSGLPPGQYRFRMKGSNNDGLWNDKGQTLMVHVLPPFWKTRWFYGLLGAGALAVAGIILFYVFRLNQEVRDRKSAQAGLRASNERLRQLDRLKDEFLANTSHELRTPLTGIIGLSESLLQGAAGPIPDPGKKDLAMIIASGRRLASLVNDILDFSKLRHKDLNLDIKAVDMKSLADVVLAITAPLTAGKPLALENRISPDLPLVLGDENRIQQILFNLVGNAVKFTAKGCVAVSASLAETEAGSAGEKFLEIRVTDTGIGIPPDKHHVIFESFEQADGSDQREFAGTGLGLAVTQKLVELHGGTLGLNSEPDQGSEFFFTLPVATEARARAEERPALIQIMDPETEKIRLPGPGDNLPLSDRKSGETHILVVDDEAVNLRVLSSQLSLENYRVTQVSSGPEALAALEEMDQKGDRIDLILLDIMMPRMSGYEVCRKLREKYPRDRLPVVMLTAKTRAEDLAAGLDSGANDYLTKPFNRTELLARIKSHRELARMIQKRDESRAALAASEEKFRNLFNNLIDVFFRTDNKGRLVLVSPSFERVTGIPADQALGMNLTQALSICPERKKQLLEQLEQSGEIQGFELSLKHRQGHRISVVTSARYYRDTQKARAGVEGIFRDITGQKQAEQMRDLLAAVIEQATELITITDTRGRILYVNPAFEAGTGYARREVLGQTPAILKSGRHPQDFYQALWATIAAGQTWKGRLTNRRKDGSEFKEEATITPVKDEAGTITHYVAVKRDVTKELLMEKQLIQSQKMEAIGTLAGGIAHDFNNILAAILGNAELGKMKTPTGPNRQRFDKVIKASRRARDLVTQILDFSRQTEIQPKPVRLKEIVSEAVKLLRATLPATIEIQSLCRSHALVMADPTQLHQILMNLGTNAGHAMHDQGGVLTIELTEPEPPQAGSDRESRRLVRMSVSDTGQGMTQAVMQRIFDPFYTTKPKGQGTGMGLAVVHGIVTRYKGEITVDSTPGQGTRFDVFLPVLEEAGAGTEKDLSAMPRGQGHILFVDDEPFQAELAQEMLEDLGYRVTAFTDSREALNRFRDHPDQFDAMVTDMTMPGMSGDLLSREVLAIRPGFPILMCTGYNERISGEKAKKIGIRAFAAKPLAMAEMARHLKDLVTPS